MTSSNHQNDATSRTRRRKVFYRRKFIQTFGTGAILTGSGSGVFSKQVSGSEQNNTIEELKEELQIIFHEIEVLGDVSSDVLLADYRMEELARLYAKINGLDLKRGMENSLTSQISSAIDLNQKAGELAIEGDKNAANNIHNTVDNILNAVIRSIDGRSNQQINYDIADDLESRISTILQARDSPVSFHEKIAEGHFTGLFFNRLEKLHNEMVSNFTTLKNYGEEINVKEIENELVIQINPLISGPLLAIAIGLALKIALGWFKVKALAVISSLIKIGSKRLTEIAVSRPEWFNTTTQLIYYILIEATFHTAIALIDRLALYFQAVYDDFSDAREELGDTYDDLIGDRPPRENADWPMFQHDVRNSGYNPHTTAPTEDIEELWRFETEEDVTAPVIVVDNEVIFGTEGGMIYIVDSETGQEHWSYKTMESKFQSPAVANNTIYLCGNESIYAIKNRQIEWKTQISGSLSDPTILNDKIYIGSDEDLYILDSESGEIEKVINFPERISFSEFGPAIFDNTVYIALDDRPDWYIYAWDLEQNEEQWLYEASGMVVPPAIGNGVVYSADLGLDAIAFDANSGDEIWRTRFEPRMDYNVIWTPPAVGEDTVFFTTDFREMGHFYAFDISTGDIKWVFRPEWHTFNSPPAAVADGVVYYGAQFDGGPYNTVFAIDIETGDELWRYSTGEDWLSRSPSVIVANGTVFINDGDVFALS